MKKLKFIFLALLLTVSSNFFTACESSNSAEEQVEETSEDVADVFRSEREELQADLRDIRQDIDERIANLENDLEQASDEAKEEINAQIDKLRSWGKEIDRDLERVGQAAQDDWKSLKSGIQESLKEFENNWKENFDS